MNTSQTHQSLVRAIADGLSERGISFIDFVRLQGSLPGITRGDEALTVDTLSRDADGNTVLHCTGDGLHADLAPSDLTEEELRGLLDFLSVYWKHSDPIRNIGSRLKALVGRRFERHTLEYILDLLSNAIGDLLGGESEGWSPTTCPEDYDDEVIFSDDFSPGIENPNMEGCNFFEVHYTENTEDLLTLNSFDLWL